MSAPDGPLISVKAQQMVRDEQLNLWKPAKGHNSSKSPLVNVSIERTDSGFDIVACSFTDVEEIFRCNIQADITYTEATRTFHHWTADSQRFGVTFESFSNAKRFKEQINLVKDKLNSSNETSDYCGSETSHDLNTSTETPPEPLVIPPRPEKPSSLSDVLAPHLNTTNSTVTYKIRRTPPPVTPPANEEEDDEPPETPPPRLPTRTTPPLAPTRNKLTHDSCQIAARDVKSMYKPRQAGFVVASHQGSAAQHHHNPLPNQIKSTSAKSKSTTIHQPAVVALPTQPIRGDSNKLTTTSYGTTSTTMSSSTQVLEDYSDYRNNYYEQSTSLQQGNNSYNKTCDLAANKKPTGGSTTSTDSTLSDKDFVVLSPPPKKACEDIKLPKKNRRPRTLCCFKRKRGGYHRGQRLQCEACDVWYFEKENYKGVCSSRRGRSDRMLDTCTCKSVQTSCLRGCNQDSASDNGFVDPRKEPRPEGLKKRCRRRALLFVLGLFLPCVWCSGPCRACHRQGVADHCWGQRHIPAVSCKATNSSL